MISRHRTEDRSSRRRGAHQICLASRCLVPRRQAFIGSCLFANAGRDGLGEHTREVAHRLCTVSEGELDRGCVQSVLVDDPSMTDLIYQVIRKTT